MQVTFLYELKEGACPKSYGTACARLAGMPESILARAEHLAAELEVATLPRAANSEQKAGGSCTWGAGAAASEMHAGHDRVPQQCTQGTWDCRPAGAAGCSNGCSYVEPRSLTVSLLYWN